MKHCLQNRLQVTTDDFLSAAICNSWDAPFELHSFTADLQDRLKLLTHFILCAANDLSF